MDQSEVLRFEQQQQIKKLSQAIRVGARLRPQCTEVLFDGVGTCALGAAAEARGWTPSSSYCDTGKWLPEVATAQNRAKPMFHQIGKWNDEGMTREAIADRLETMGY